MITVIIMREDTICQKASNSRFHLTLTTHKTLNFKQIFKPITLNAETKSARYRDVQDITALFLYTAYLPISLSLSLMLCEI